MLNSLSQEEAKEQETLQQLIIKSLLTGKAIQMVLPLPATLYVSKNATAGAENKMPRGTNTP